MAQRKALVSGQNEQNKWALIIYEKGHKESNKWVLIIHTRGHKESNKLALITVEHAKFTTWRSQSCLLHIIFMFTESIHSGDHASFL